MNPISGNTGSPVPKLIDGISASLLCDNTAAALLNIRGAARTLVLLRCARSTTVASETCACAFPATKHNRASTAIAQSAHSAHPPPSGFKMKAPVRVCKSCARLQRCRLLLPGAIFVAQLRFHMSQQRVRLECRRFLALRIISQVLLQHLLCKCQVALSLHQHSAPLYKATPAADRAAPLCSRCQPRSAYRSSAPACGRSWPASSTGMQDGRWSVVASLNSRSAVP